MDGEDSTDRPNDIATIIDGLERYNPEAVPALEEYLAKQCEEKFCDCNANRTLLKLYQLNPDRLQNEIVTNILVKAMTQFPSSQFSLGLHLIPPAAAGSGELYEAVAKLRALNGMLEGSRFAAFWASLDGDDLCADLIADISGFEELIRQRIAAQIGRAYRELPLTQLASWLGLEADAAAQFVAENGGWTVAEDGSGIVKVPRNAENEAKKAEVREDVGVEMFGRVIRRSWEETMGQTA